MKKRLLISVLSFGLIFSTWAQEGLDRIHLGVKGGIGISKGSYSEMKSHSSKMNVGGVGGVFAEFEFGESRLFSIRPEVDWLSRGIKVSDDNLDYRLKAKYVDFRLPLVFNFGSPEGVRPFLYVAPVVGFVRGGNITLNDWTGDYEIDVTKASMASTYFAGAIGGGVKIPIPVSDNKRLQLTFEANYQYGFTDTYSDIEKDGDAIALNRPFYNLTGNRKLQGFEITASLSIPLSIFKRSPKKKVLPEPIPVTQPQPVVEEKPIVVKEEKPCYSLEEIMEAMSRGETITGRTICAIDIINFEFDKSVIKEESYPYLEKIVRLMKSTPIHVIVKGHTDNVGNAEYNMQLSKRRAEAVYNHLLRSGVDASHLEYEYYGMSRPISSNDTPEGRVINRRVEFEITEQ
ncbi:OmpA family protein [Parabacteroides sp.]